MSVTRLAVALLFSLAVSAGLWVASPDHLVQPDDIVGYPSFFDYNYQPVFLAHRLFTWVIPGLTALTYWSLTRVGPLRSTPTADPTTEPTSELVEPSDDATTEPERRTVLRLLPPVAVLLVAGSAGTSQVDQGLSVAGVLAAALYVGLVTVATLIVRSRTARADASSIVNAVATPLAAFAGLFLFAHRTGTVDASGVLRTWPWLPWWLVLVAGLATVAWVTRQLGRSEAAGVERRVVTVLAGSVLVYILAARLPSDVPRLQGFDDMHAVTGADLLTRGYFPWRDVVFMHGVFEDALRANLAFLLFEHSVWGTLAAATMIWAPLLFVGYYLLSVWAAPRQWLLHTAVVAAVAWSATVFPPSVRWVAIGYLFILLGHTLRYPRVRSTVGLTVALFVTAVLVPEASFLVIAVATVLVVHDLTRRDCPGPWWRRLKRTRVFVLTGMVLTLTWSGFLASIGALSAWIDYYLYFGPGHAASGALPLDLTDNGPWETVFILIEVVTVVALAWSLARLVRGKPFDARDGVLLAAALTTGLYAEKGLGRFDVGHIGQTLTVAVCLWVVFLAVLIDAVPPALDRLLGRPPTPQLASATGPAAGPRWNARLTTAARRNAGGLIVLLVTALVVPATTGLPNVGRLIDQAPSHNRSAVFSQSGNPEMVGYTAPDGTDMEMVSDLALLLDRLAPPGERIYDFTNSPGYFTYLLQQRLPSRFYTVGLALPEIAQEQLLDDLKGSNPAVVVLDDLYYGLPMWDGPRNESRHYLVSPYLLDGWTPVASTYGFLFLLRNDLVDGMPALPALSRPVVTEDLYFSMPECGWGHIPDYLHATPTGVVQTLDVGPYDKNGRTIRGSGWAYDATAGDLVTEVVIAVGNTVVGRALGNLERLDVAIALSSKPAESSGYSFTVFTERKGTLRVYAVLADGRAHPIEGQEGSPPPWLEEPDGTRLVTSDEPSPGAVDSLQSSKRWTAKVSVPPGVDLADYGLATFVTSEPALGSTSLRLFGNEATPALSREITLKGSRPDSQSVSVRVGACLQWHGFTGRNLFLSQSGGSRVSQIQLSQVAAD